eukprot:556183_1
MSKSMSRLHLMDKSSSSLSLFEKDKTRRNLHAVDKVLSHHSTVRVEDNEVCDRLMDRYTRMKINNIQANCECGNILIRRILTTNKQIDCDNCKTNIRVNNVIYSCPKIHSPMKDRYKICEKCAIDVLFTKFRNTTLYDPDEDEYPTNGGKCGIQCLIQ